MAELWDLGGEEGGWSPLFSRSFNDWKLEGVQIFLQVIQGKRGISNQKDVLLMKDVKGSCFSVKHFYLQLAPMRDSLFPFRFVWNPWVPTKVGFFAWEASWGKVLTLNQLKKRGRTLANWCFLCGEGEETVNHLLIHCSKARMLWELFLAIFGVNWVFPFLVKEALLSWHGSFVGKHRKKAWMTAPLCIFWTIWWERNRLVFEDGNISINRMKSTFLCNLWSWA